MRELPDVVQDILPPEAGHHAPSYAKVPSTQAQPSYLVSEVTAVLHI